MQTLYRVLYCSRTHLPDGARVNEELHEILTASRRNNARAGITGGLLFSQGCFAQVLEGPMDQVIETFERIQCDPRHRDVTVLQAERIEDRGFPAWSMGFAGAAGTHNPLPDIGLATAPAGSEVQHQITLDLLKAVIVREDDRLQHG